MPLYKYFKLQINIHQKNLWKKLLQYGKKGSKKKYSSSDFQNAKLTFHSYIYKLNQVMAQALKNNKYKVLEERIKKEILGRELLDKKVQEFTNSLGNLSDGDMRNIMRSRYRNIFGQIRPIMHQQPQQNLPAFKEIFHKSCQPEFQEFVNCYYNESLKKKDGKEQQKGKKCVGQGNKYLFCFEKNMKNLILSSVQLY